MIKFLAHRDGRPLIGLGLSRENCRKLLEGKPIFIDLKVMFADVEEPPVLDETTVLIFGGETEETMQGELKQYLGELPPATPHKEEN